MSKKLLEVEYNEGEYTVKFAPRVVLASETVDHLKNANKELLLAAKSVINKVKPKGGSGAQRTKINVEEEEEKRDSSE